MSSAPGWAPELAETWHKHDLIDMMAETPEQLKYGATLHLTDRADELQTALGRVTATTPQGALAQLVVLSDQLVRILDGGCECNRRSAEHLFERLKIRLVEHLEMQAGFS